jgi:hypothetical protein
MTDCAALYVDPQGIYATIPAVECWGLPDRDAREYAGPYPVVAHPPCSRWCRLAGLVEARWGHRRGDDGGCFRAALAAVRTWGGVLEHPAYSDAWPAYDLLAPPTGGGWVRADWHTGHSGWTCYIEQARYGHPAKKAAWLYAHGVDGVELPTLRWGHVPDQKVKALVSWCGNHTRSSDSRPRLGKRKRSATPVLFAEVLVAIARTAQYREDDDE